MHYGKVVVGDGVTQLLICCCNRFIRRYWPEYVDINVVEKCGRMRYKSNQPNNGCKTRWNLFRVLTISIGLYVIFRWIYALWEIWYWWWRRFTATYMLLKQTYTAVLIGILRYKCRRKKRTDAIQFDKAISIELKTSDETYSQFGIVVFGVQAYLLFFVRTAMMEITKIDDHTAQERAGDSTHC